MVKRWHTESIEGSTGPRLCKQSAEGSLIVLIRKVLLLLAITHIWPSQNSQIISCSSFICFAQGKTLRAYNETLKGRANKRCSQITVASRHCHHLRSSALIYKHCPIGFGAITKPIGMTPWMAVESDLLKKQRSTQCCMTPSRNRCRDTRVYNWFSRATSCCHSLSNEPLAGALLLVEHGVSDRFATLTPLEWHHTWTSPVEFPHGQTLVLF